VPGVVACHSSFATSRLSRKLPVWHVQQHFTISCPPTFGKVTDPRLAKWEGLQGLSTDKMKKIIINRSIEASVVSTPQRMLLWMRSRTNRLQGISRLGTSAAMAEQELRETQLERWGKRERWRWDDEEEE